MAPATRIKARFNILIIIKYYKQTNLIIFIRSGLYISDFAREKKKNQFIH